MKRRPQGRPSFLSLKNTLRGDLYTASEPSDGIFETVSRPLQFQTLQNIAEPLDEAYFPAVQSTFQDVEDRRTYYPGGPNNRPPASPRRSPSKLKVVNYGLSPGQLVGGARRAAGGKIQYQFKSPKHVAICVRRNTRKEVMHATGVAGGRVSRRRKFNQYSTVRC